MWIRHETQSLRMEKEFLTNRRQRVVVNGKYTEWIKVTSGIPQGSVLEPILFIIFINNMPEVTACCMKIYADDAKIYDRVNNIVQSTRLQRCITNVEEWANDWNMFFNFGKCKHVHYGSHDENFRYTMVNSDELMEIQNVISENDLGVLVDNKLLFREHIAKKVGTVNRKLGIIFETFEFMDKEMFLKLYKSLVRPDLEYATVIWSPHFT